MEFKRSVQSVICLEFKLREDPLDSLASLRQVNLEQYNTNFCFRLDGIVHGKSLSNENEFQVQVNGEDIA